MWNFYFHHRQTISTTCNDSVIAIVVRAASPIPWQQLPIEDKDGNWPPGSNYTPGPSLDWIICHLLESNKKQLRDAVVKMYILNIV